MNSKNFILSFSFVVILIVSAFGQTETTVSKLPKPILNLGLTKVDLPEYFKVGEVKGNIGGAKAVELYKPAYSEEAKSKGSEGQVKVEIEIDENGSVTAAKAVSGDRTLYESAENAALRSKFLTPKIDGQRTRVKGVLNYDFYIEKPNWFAAVFGLVPLDSNINAFVTKKAFAADWKEEIELIDKLALIRSGEPVNLKPTIINAKTGLSPKQKANSSTLTALILPPAPPNPEAAQISQTLLTLLQNRLVKDQMGLWQFNLNLSLFNVLNIYRDPAKRRLAVVMLENNTQNMPDGISDETKAELQNLIRLFEKGEKNTDFHKELMRIMTYFARAEN
ncbi:MAG: energy transducer TonB [Pyrinomonadaceae bacterium]|nr:energy transducer TonB [Pyrinomonadaceae bacterium]